MVAAPPPPPRTYRVEALAKGLRLLALFSDRRPELRLKEIVRLTGLPMPTAFRLVATLIGEGFIERSPDGVLRPGTAVLTLGFSALHGVDLVTTATPILRQLADASGQTVNLGVLSGAEVLYVCRFAGTALVTANVRVGSTLPAVVTSMGKLLLAFEDDDANARRLRDGAFDGAWGPNAVRSLEALNQQLAQIRADRFAVQDEELARGLRSVAAPVRRGDGRVAAAVNVAVLAVDYTLAELLARFRDPLVQACTEITRRLGRS